MINMTDEYITRGGRPSRVLCIDGGSAYPVVVLIEGAYSNRTERMTADGRYMRGQTCDDDLIKIVEKTSRPMTNMETLWLCCQPGLVVKRQPEDDWMPISDWMPGEYTHESVYATIAEDGTIGEPQKFEKAVSE